MRWSLCAAVLAAVLVVAGSTAGATDVSAPGPTYAIAGMWSVKVIGCNGKTYTYELSVTGYSQSTGAFSWALLNPPGTPGNQVAASGNGSDAANAVSMPGFPFGGQAPQVLQLTVSFVGSSLTMAGTYTCTASSGKVTFTMPGLIVNSTQTGVNQTEVSQGVCNITPTQSTATCTLPQAIEVSNDLGGRQIGFNIPADVNGVANSFDAKATGVPSIISSAGMPAISAPTVIDGSTQPGGVVELDGSSVPNNGNAYSPCGVGPAGVEVLAGGAGSTIEGMDIHGFGDQIDLQGGSDTIQDDELGTNPTGTVAEPNLRPLPEAGIYIASSGNRIGGTTAGSGNVISGNDSYNPLTSGKSFGQTNNCSGIYSPSAADGGNLIQGNTIGPALGQTGLLYDYTSPNYRADDYSQLLGLHLSGGSDTVGGSQPGAGNVIAGAVGLFGAGDVVQGNTFAGGVNVAADQITLGGATSTPGAAPGNRFARNELAVDGSRDVVQGNVVSGSTLAGILVSGSNETIGGSTPNLGNLIENNGTSKVLPPYYTGAGGILVGPYGGAPSNADVIEYNVIKNNGGAGGVEVYQGVGDHILANSMSGNALGINLGGGPFRYHGILTGMTAGPNNYQPYPELDAVTMTGGALTVGGRQSGVFGQTQTIQLYSQPSCAEDSVTPGQGLHYLGQAIESGNRFTLRFPPAAAGDHAVTATATASDDSTSELSPCLTIGRTALSFNQSGVIPTSPTVTVTTSATSLPAAAQVAAAPKKPAKRKTTTARGFLQLLCPPITIGSCTGTLALAGPNAVTLIRSRFKLSAGQGDPITLRVPASLLTRLEHHDRLRAVATITAHDNAGQQHTKTTHTKLALLLVDS